MKRRRINLLICTVIVSVPLLAACSSATQELPAPVSAKTSAPAASEAAPLLQESPYPSPTARDVPVPSPLPYPGSTPSSGTPYVAYVVPEPTSDTGVVVGQLFDVETGEPLPFQSVYLATKIYLTPGPAYNYALQENSSPHTVTNEEGKFAIGGVKPGNYILMIYHPFAASVIMEPNTDRELEVVVTAGQVLELGDVKGPVPFE